MRRNRWVQVVVLGLCILWIVPPAETVLCSFVWEGRALSLGQYRRILIESPVYLHRFWNSVRLTLPIVAGNILVSLLGAYAFWTLHFAGKELLFTIYLVLMLLPLQVTLMPNYMVAAFLGIQDSYLAVILPGIFHPFGVFLLRQQMKWIPAECIEAARLDGAGEWQIFRYCVAPMVRSQIAALGMLLVMEYWNLIDQAIVFIRQEKAYPLSVFLAEMVRKTPETAYAGATYYLVPMAALLCWGHEYLRQGIGMLGGERR